MGLGHQQLLGRGLPAPTRQDGCSRCDTSKRPTWERLDPTHRPPEVARGAETRASIGFYDLNRVRAVATASTARDRVRPADPEGQRPHDELVQSERDHAARRPAQRARRAGMYGRDAAEPGFISPISVAICVRRPARGVSACRGFGDDRLGQPLADIALATGARGAQLVDRQPGRDGRCERARRREPLPGVERLMYATAAPPERRPRPRTRCRASGRRSRTQTGRNSSSSRSRSVMAPRIPVASSGAPGATEARAWPYRSKRRESRSSSPRRPRRRTAVQ